MAMMKRRATRFIGSVLAIAIATALVFGCAENGGSSGDRHVGTVKAHPESPELLERSYGYLLRGDRDFIRMAPNYATLRPFNPDTSIVVETRSQAEKVDSPTADFMEHLVIRINREMPVRVVVADSTGQGLIVYDMQELPVGAYTVGSKGWPVPQVEQTDGHDWVYIYVVADTRFRWRERFALDDKGNLLPLAPLPEG
jgi:hypothetical protein